MVEPAEREQLAKVLRSVSMRICVQQDVPDEEECLVMAKRHVKDIIKRIDLEEIISLPRDGKQDDKKKRAEKKRAAAAAEEAAAGCDWVKRRKSAK
eukprot:s2446_g10.t1